MSGTLLEGRAELRAVYGMSVVRVPCVKPSRRAVLPTRVFGTHEARWGYIAGRAREIQAHGGAVLVGTDSVADSQLLSRHLDAAALRTSCSMRSRTDTRRTWSPRRDRLGASQLPPAWRAGAPTSRSRSALLEPAGYTSCCARRMPRGASTASSPAAARGAASREAANTAVARVGAGRRVPAGVYHGLDRTGGELRPRWVGVLLARVTLWWEGRRRYRLRLQLRLQDEALDRQPMMGASSR